jgi:hypothetical protein
MEGRKERSLSVFTYDETGAFKRGFTPLPYSSPSPDNLAWRGGYRG